MSESEESRAIERDRALAFELFEVQPENPQVANLAASVLARDPDQTDMLVLLADYRRNLEEYDEARTLLHQAIGRQDEELDDALRSLRSVEYRTGNNAEAKRVAEMLVEGRAEPRWTDVAMLAVTVTFAESPQRGWAAFDEAIELAARTDPESYADALVFRATFLHESGAPVDVFLPAAELAIAADPTQDLLAVLLATAYLYELRPREADVLLKRVLRGNPTDEFALGTLRTTRTMIDPVERGEVTEAEMHEVGVGEFVWRYTRELMYDVGVKRALEALEAVMPADLAASLRPGVSAAEAREGGGDTDVLQWRDGQHEGAGDVWGIGESWRLLTNADIAQMDAEIETHPERWPLLNEDAPTYITQLFIDGDGNYILTARGGRLVRRTAAGDEELAPSLAEWFWERVRAFGGHDRRPDFG